MNKARKVRVTATLAYSMIFKESGVYLVY